MVKTRKLEIDFLSISESQVLTVVHLLEKTSQTLRY